MIGKKNQRVKIVQCEKRFLIKNTKKEVFFVYNIFKGTFFEARVLSKGREATKMSRD